MPPTTRQKRKLNLNAPYPAHINLPQLPGIVLEHIFTSVGATSTSSSCAITRSSKLFYDLATPILYRTFWLTSDDQMTGLLKGLDSKEAMDVVAGRRYSKRAGSKRQERAAIKKRLENFGFTRHIVLDYVPTTVLCERDTESIIFGASFVNDIHPKRRSPGHRIFGDGLPNLARLANPYRIEFDLTTCGGEYWCQCILQIVEGIEPIFTRLTTVNLYGPASSFNNRGCVSSYTTKPLLYHFTISALGSVAGSASSPVEVGYDSNERHYPSFCCESLWFNTLGRFCGERIRSNKIRISLSNCPEMKRRAIELGVDNIHAVCCQRHTSEGEEGSVAGIQFE